MAPRLPMVETPEALRERLTVTGMLAVGLGTLFYDAVDDSASARRLARALGVPEAALLLVLANLDWGCDLSPAEIDELQAAPEMWQATRELCEAAPWYDED